MPQNFEALNQQVKKQCVQVSNSSFTSNAIYVSDQLKLLTPYDSTLLHTDQRKEIVRQARRILEGKDPFWVHVYDIRVITIYDDKCDDQRPKNFINIRTKPDFVSMIHHERAGTCKDDQVLFCFMASDQLEPIVTVVVLNAEQGKLVEISKKQVDWLQTALEQFKIKYGLSGERFAYTPIKYRVKNKWHSKHFHIKIRIPTEMYLHIFPSVRILAASRSDLQIKLFELEPLEYAFSRQQTQQWHEVRQQIYDDIEDANRFCVRPLTAVEEAQVEAMRRACGVFD